MKFEKLYQNLLDMPNEGIAFFEHYCERRKSDLESVTAKVTVQKERGKGKKEKMISVSREQMELLRALNLA